MERPIPARCTVAKTDKGIPSIGDAFDRPFFCVHGYASARGPRLSGGECVVVVRHKRVFFARTPPPPAVTTKKKSRNHVPASNPAGDLKYLMRERARGDSFEYHTQTYLYSSSIPPRRILYATR